jgi:hypothetical protein
MRRSDRTENYTFAETPLPRFRGLVSICLLCCIVLGKLLCEEAACECQQLIHLHVDENTVSARLLTIPLRGSFDAEEYSRRV